jgi:uncharacterized iron-regulated protein
MAKMSIIFISLVFSSLVSAQIYLGDGQTQADLSKLVDQVKPGSVVVIGEMHNQQTIHDQQMLILEALWDKGLNVTVGMEFFNYTDQMFVEQFRSGEIDETAFKTLVNWGGYDFNLYKDQLLFGDYGLGINLTRDVTQVISKQGLSALSPTQQKLLPPQFTIGRDSYRQRFFQAMGAHVPSAAMENYFVAQSAWDDTMAWQTLEFKKDHPDQVFVIIVGEFHVQYGGGLPNRLKARFADAGVPLDIVTVSQVLSDGLTPDEIKTELAPSATEGQRSDFIWLN